MNEYERSSIHAGDLEEDGVTEAMRLTFTYSERAVQCLVLNDIRARMKMRGLDSGGVSAGDVRIGESDDAVAAAVVRVFGAGGLLGVQEAAP